VVYRAKGIVDIERGDKGVGMTDATTKVFEKCHFGSLIAYWCKKWLLGEGRGNSIDLEIKLVMASWMLMRCIAHWVFCSAMH
jgi:hypothetical protein